MLSFKDFSNELLIIESIRYMDRTLFKPIMDGKYNVVCEDAEVAETGYLANDAEIELIKTYQADPNSNEGREALNKLVENKMPFVYKKVGDFIKTHPNCAKEKDDLVQEASLALVKAAENFKVDSGVIFTAYATKCINGAILNAINTNRRKSIDNFKGDTGEMISIDAKISGDRGEYADKATTISDLLPDDDTPITNLEKDEQKAMIQDWIKQLPDTEQTAIKMMFLPEDGNKSATLEEIGKKIGMSAMGVKKLIDRVRAKLQKMAREEW